MAATKFSTTAYSMPTKQALAFLASVAQQQQHQQQRQHKQHRHQTPTQIRQQSRHQDAKKWHRNHHRRIIAGRRTTAPPAHGPRSRIGWSAGAAHDNSSWSLWPLRCYWIICCWPLLVSTTYKPEEIVHLVLVSCPIYAAPHNLCDYFLFLFPSFISHLFTCSRHSVCRRTVM